MTNYLKEICYDNKEERSYEKNENISYINLGYFVNISYSFV